MLQPSASFLGRLRLGGACGVLAQRLAELLVQMPGTFSCLETAAAWEKEGSAHGEIRPVMGAVG